MFSSETTVGPPWDGSALDSQCEGIEQNVAVLCEFHMASFWTILVVFYICRLLLSIINPFLILWTSEFNSAEQ